MADWDWPDDLTDEEIIAATKVADEMVAFLHAKFADRRPFVGEIRDAIIEWDRERQKRTRDIFCAAIQVERNAEDPNQLHVMLPFHRTVRP